MVAKISRVGFLVTINIEAPISKESTERGIGRETVGG